MAKQKIKIEKIKKQLVTAASKFVSNKEAEYFAYEQIECVLRMYPDRNTIKQAIHDLEVWSKAKNKEVKVLADKSGSFLVDFNRLGPSLKLKWVHDKLEEKARKNGIAMFGINNSAVIDWLKLWTYPLAKRGMIALCMVNGGPATCVPYGGSIPIFGTNPLSYAIPTEKEPILLDMATSKFAFYKYVRAEKSNKPVRENCLVDENGNPTTDPQKAATDDDNARILPMGGGYKGYGIVLLVEILTGALVRSFIGRLEKSSEYKREEYGHLIIAIDVSSMTDLNSFKVSVQKMCDDIRSQKPGDHVDKVVVPGDYGLERANRLREAGEIEMEKKLIEKLSKLAK